MSLQLIAFKDQPGSIVVTKNAAAATDGRFLLDFSRKLEVIRWFGVRNRYVGPAVGLLVPIIHERETSGGYVFAVTVTEPYFHDLRKLWKTYYPAKLEPVREEAGGLQIIADFATHFPEEADPRQIHST